MVGILRRADGSVRLAYPNFRRWDPSKETKEQFTERFCGEVIRKAHPDTDPGVFVGIVPLAEAKTLNAVQRDQRHKWEFVAGKLVVNTESTRLRPIPDESKRAQLNKRDELLKVRPAAPVTVQDLLDLGLI